MNTSHEVLKATLRLLIKDWTSRLEFQSMSDHEAEELTKSIREANKLLKELSHDGSN